MKSAIGNRGSQIAFTLIELLVVITIIVVLLALLAPALDQAIYQAELASCGARLSSIASGGITYAAANARMYPRNRNPRDGGYQPPLIGWANDPTRDLRPIIRPYISLKTMSCPLTQELDLSETANDSKTQVMASYDLWMGWQYSGPLAGKALRRLGDRLTWIDDLNDLALSADFLASDMNAIRITNLTISSHPDGDGALFEDVHQDDPVSTGDVEVEGFGLSTFNMTASRWYQGADRPPRGLVDLNFALADGSVRRYQEVTGSFNAVYDGDGTSFYAAPWFANSTNLQKTAKRWLPAQR